MGGKVSRTVIKKSLRPIKNINVENRAHKAIEQHKIEPVVAPRHPSTEHLYDKLVSEHPEIQEDLEKKDTMLIERMNKLQVDVSHQPQKLTSDRPLPQSKVAIDDPLLHLENPAVVKKGKLSLKQVLDILDKCKHKEFSADDVAKTYNITLNESYCLTKYFQKLDTGDLINVKLERKKIQEQERLKLGSGIKDKISQS